MTGPIIVVVVWVITMWTVGDLLLRAWSRGRFAARDRFSLVRAAVDSVLVLGLTRAVLPPPGPLSWVWVAAAGAVGVGIAGAVLRTAPRPDPTGPTGRTGAGGRTGRRRDVLAGLYVAAGALLLVALA